MHGYMKLMMGPFFVLRGYPLVDFGSTPPPLDHGQIVTQEQVAIWFFVELKLSIVLDYS
jgi:hypothetical protein